MQTETDQGIRLTREENIGHLRIDSPPSNRMTIGFFSSLHEIIQAVRADSKIKALVISGKGRHFSSGADLESLLDAIHEKIPPFMVNHYQTFADISDLEIPVIAAIRGVCLGSAMELALACHFRFCSPDALFGLPETSFNLIPGLGGGAMLTRIAGKATALELILSGRTFQSDEALKRNIVDHIFPKKELLTMAAGFAANILPNYRKQKKNLYLRTLHTP